MSDEELQSLADEASHAIDMGYNSIRVSPWVVLFLITKLRELIFINNLKNKKDRL